VNSISAGVSFLRVTVTTTHAVGTLVPGAIVVPVKSSPSTSILNIVPKSSSLTAVPSFFAENTISLRSTSSSPALEGLIVNLATSLLDFIRTVFFALELTSRDPCSTTFTLAVSSSAFPAGLLSSSSHSNAMLNVLDTSAVVGVSSISTKTLTDFQSVTLISSISHFASPALH
jgi:hypothetical protein